MQNYSTSPAQWLNVITEHLVMVLDFMFCLCKFVASDWQRHVTCDSLYAKSFQMHCMCDAFLCFQYVHSVSQYYYRICRVLFQIGCLPHHV